MPTVYLSSNPSISASCPPLKPRQQEVTKAYFAKREEDEQYKTSVKDHTTKAGETLSKIAKNYNVDAKNVKRTKTTKYLQVGEIVKVTTKEKTGVKVKFTKLDKATVGEDVYIVVETLHLEDEIVNINVLQGQEDVLVKKDELVTVQQNDQDVTLIKTKVGNYCEEDNITNKDDFKNFAIAKIKLQPKTETKQKEWKDGLDCAGEKKALLYLLVDVHSENSIPNFKSQYVLYKGFKSGKDNNPIPNHFLNEDKAWFTITQSKTIHIYHTGEISKVDLKGAKKVSYIYHDKNDKQHDLGEFDIIEVEEFENGDTLDSIPEKHTKKETINNEREKYTYANSIVIKGTKGNEKDKIRKYVKTGNKTPLIKIKSLNHVKNDITIKFNLKSGSTRPYIHPNAYASVLGAVAEVGYTDITMIGFTSEDNHGFPSKTHVNGKHGDFRYLRKDKSGGSLHINTAPKELDITRQEKMIDAFFNFGWPLFYSYEFVIDKKKKLLKKSKHLEGHNHHIHSRKFNPKFK